MARPKKEQNPVARNLAQKFCNWRFEVTNNEDEKNGTAFFKNYQAFNKAVKQFGEEYIEYALNYCISKKMNIYSSNFFLKEIKQIKEEYYKSKTKQTELVLPNVSNNTSFKGSGNTVIKSDYELE